MDPLVLRQHLDLEERHWWFVARRKIVLDLLDQYLLRRNDLEVLDAGCGGGATLKALSRYGRARGMDLSEEAVAYNLEQRRDVVRGSIEQMPFVDETFDLVLALDVIEHVPADLAAIAELDRILKPGGYLLVTVPALRLLWGPHDIANSHYRRYTLGGLRARVETSGFEAVRATYFSTLLLPAILAVRLLRRLRGKGAASDIGEVTHPLNAVLEAVFSLEAPLLRRWDLPVGVSALCLARKVR